METFMALTYRHSVRSYLEKKVEDEKVSKLIIAANSVPQAGSFHITIVENREMLDKIDQYTIEAMKASPLQFLRELAEKPGFKPMFNAPVMFVFSSPSADPFGVANCSNAATAVCIEATDMGLGSCFVVTPTMALSTHMEICNQIGVPTDYKCHCCVMTGYTNETFKDQSVNKTVDNVNYYR